MLATPNGELTWARQGSRCSTLDLIWFTGGMNVLYEGAGDWHGPDHVPQRATVRGSGAPIRGAKRRNWKMLDTGKAEKLAEGGLGNKSWGGTTADEVDAAIVRSIRISQFIRDSALPTTSGKLGKAEA